MREYAKAGKKYTQFLFHKNVYYSMFGGEICAYSNLYIIIRLRRKKMYNKTASEDNIWVLHCLNDLK